MNTSLTSTGESQSKFHEIISRPRAGWQRYVILFWALMGPGFLAAMADNDAGGVISYLVTGARFGISVFVPLVLCLALLTYTVQEMSLRLGVVTREGFSRLVLRRYGRAWGFYLITTLALENLLTLMTEFIGMTAGLVLLGVPLLLASLICLILIISFAVFTGYWAKERLALLIGALNIVFLAVAAMTHPNMSEIARVFVTWNVPEALQAGFVFYLIATVGNALAPWMIFFQGSGVIDKGIRAHELRFGRLDTAFGSLVQVVVAAGIIILGASLFGKVPNLAGAGPSEIIAALAQVVGRWPAILFGLGLFNAGFLASITVSLSSSWSIAELFGWSKSLNDKIREAPRFYLVYIGSLVLASLALLIPNLPLNLIALATQVIGGILMVPLLIFMVLMTSDQGLMGSYRTKLPGRLWSWTVIVLLSGLTLAALGQVFLNAI
ncbi:divalent metal cation transporter MntH [Peptococcaceae bacterium CEB3]|nr:divalent metal cation transporter MntH [Peptococcaceae bacterium CEB3]